MQPGAFIEPSLLSTAIPSPVPPEVHSRRGQQQRMQVVEQGGGNVSVDPDQHRAEFLGCVAVA